MNFLVILFTRDKLVQRVVEFYYKNFSIVLTKLLTHELFLEPAMTIDILKFKCFFLLGNSQTVLTAQIIIRLSRGKLNRKIYSSASVHPKPLSILAIELWNSTDVRPLVEIVAILHCNLDKGWELIARVKCDQFHVVGLAIRSWIHPISLEIHCQVINFRYTSALAIRVWKWIVWSWPWESCNIKSYANYK